jgi:hypothetical protein
MRHMGAIFFKQFKNKHLMNVLKRLCGQNENLRSYGINLMTSLGSIEKEKWAHQYFF